MQASRVMPLVAARAPLLLAGAVFGALFAFYEMVMGYVPMVWRWTPAAVFGEEFLLTAAFHVLFFSAVSLPTLLLPRRLRRIETVCCYYLAAACVITLLGSQRENVVVAVRAFSTLASLGTMYGAFKLWRGGGRAGRFGIVTASLVAGMIPFALVAFGSKVPEASVAGGAPRAGGRPNILFVVFDTVSKGSLPAYGYGRDTAPVFSGVAARGALFLDARTTSNWTVASHASMFTGRYPVAHGATHEHPYLDDRETALPEHLRAAGYRTAAFSCNPWVGRGTGFHQGFDHVGEMWRGHLRDEIYLLHRFWSVWFDARKDKGGARLVEELEAWADGAGRERPWFAFVNLLESHAPFNQVPDAYAGRYLAALPPPAERARVGSLSTALQLFWHRGPVDGKDRRMMRDLHDGGIAYDDALLGRILAALRSRGMLENTIVVLATDHGELFGEHGVWGHEVSLWEGLTGIALSVTWEGVIPAGLRVGAPVSAVDLFPTLHELSGAAVPLPPGQHGRSLVPLLKGEAAGPRPPLVAESAVPLHLNLSWRYNHPFQPPPAVLKQRWTAVWEGPLKLLRVEDEAGAVVGRMLFDVGADPGETNDLAASRPADVARLEAALDRWREEMAGQAFAGGAPAPLLDEETIEGLRNLGYIEGAP